MTIYENLIRKSENCITASNRCFNHGHDDMADMWYGKAIDLRLRANCSTIEQAEQVIFQSEKIDRLIGEIALAGFFVMFALAIGYSVIAQVVLR